jgi:hypothetical protein
MALCLENGAPKGAPYRAKRIAATLVSMFRALRREVQSALPHALRQCDL